MVMIERPRHHTQVVPKGLARIRVQLSAAHTPEQIDKCVAAFTAIGRAKGVVK
jgi:glycine C-acetyltransferase